MAPDATVPIDQKLQLPSDAEPANAAQYEAMLQAAPETLKKSATAAASRANALLRVNSTDWALALLDDTIEKITGALRQLKACDLHAHVPSMSNAPAPDAHEAAAGVTDAVPSTGFVLVEAEPHSLSIASQDLGPVPGAVFSKLLSNIRIDVKVKRGQNVRPAEVGCIPKKEADFVLDVLPITSLHQKSINIIEAEPFELVIIQPGKKPQLAITRVSQLISLRLF